MANCAIIDVGSNSVRLTAYHYSKDGYTCYLNEREILGLAAYIQNNRLNDVGIQKLIKVLKRYRTLIHDLAISQYTVLATAAIRNVENTEEIIAKVDAMTGITMQVLSGETEARLDFTGVLSEVPDRNGIIVDVGGGSSEIILFENREIVQAMSIPVGSLQVYTMRRKFHPDAKRAQTDETADCQAA